LKGLRIVAPFFVLTAFDFATSSHFMEDDELAALDAELRALESSTAEPKPGPRAPKVISSAPVRSSAVSAVATASAPTINGARLPPSQWATPDQIAAQLRSEGLVVPLPPPQVILPALSASDPFIPSSTFTGPKAGYVFKAGPKGVGYYLEGASTSAASSSSALPHASVHSSAGSSSALMAPSSHTYTSVAASSSKSPVGHAKAETSRAPNTMRTIAGMTWEDKSLAEWPDDDFRVFIGDLGNEVNDDVLTHAFQKYPSFQKAKVVRDGRTNKSKGYGFVSFRDPWDMTKALREMNGKYVGNRPMKVRKSTAADRMVTADHQPLQLSHALGVHDKSIERQLKRGGAIHTEPGWKKNKKPKNGMPW